MHGQVTKTEVDIDYLALCSPTDTQMYVQTRRYSPYLLVLWLIGRPPKCSHSSHLLKCLVV